MTDGPKYGFDTLQIHAGARPDPATGARQTPIYQTTAYVFRDAEHAAALFNLQEVGYIYSRLTNPTVAVLQERIATLEGGVGAVCCSSGHAAQLMALFPLMSPGKNVVVSTRLYGGTVTQFSQTIKRFGWSATFVDFDDFAYSSGRDVGPFLFRFGIEAPEGIAFRPQSVMSHIVAVIAGENHYGAFFQIERFEPFEYTAKVSVDPGDTG